MRIYRVQGSTGDEWVVEWCERLHDARTVRSNLEHAGYEVHVDQVEVHTGRAGLVAALNHAQVNRVNWPGEPVR